MEQTLTRLHTYLQQYTKHSPRVVYALLSRGADTRIRNNLDCTPIMERLCNRSYSHNVTQLARTKGRRTTSTLSIHKT
ncbi:ankyrin-like protein [Vaccinia virus]|nr:ankyrin-like protein [Vaccinia virus]AUO38514.1 ankyrin-like protein [Vaccinia virus]UIC71744.1 ankyrin-like protein [Vaccinia virus]UIC71975.1 ankyrin-like protein [Vaccinia virus]